MSEGLDLLKDINYLSDRCGRSKLTSSFTNTSTPLENLLKDIKYLTKDGNTKETARFCSKWMHIK
jgi:hypothetical protein